MLDYCIKDENVSPLVSVVIIDIYNMFQFSSLLGSKVPPSSSAFLSQVDQVIRANSSFMQTIEKWRNLEISYLSKLAELQAEITCRHSDQQAKSDVLLLRSIDILKNNHNALVNKINHDIFLTNFEEAQKKIMNQRALLEQEKTLHKQLTRRKEEMEKVQGRKTKLRKNMEQELILKIFSEDSCQATMARKMKRFNKLKQITKQQGQYDLKVKETKEVFDCIIFRSKQNLKKFLDTSEMIYSIRVDMAMKFQLHMSTFAKNLANDLEEVNSDTPNIPEIPEKNLVNKYIEEEEEYIANVSKQSQGYLETTLKLIQDKSIDDIIEYSKDKEIKKKIKRVIESTNINPEETDELTRQVQLVKKIMKGEWDSMTQFKQIIVKSCKFRMNFVFILQMYRLNSQFQIEPDQLKPMILLINELLNTCHQHRDAFALKQIMVLMLTYYVIHREEGAQGENKVFLISFFKHLNLWKEIELWQSILIECIYLQKKATIRMLLVTSSTSNRNQLMEAEKTAVLNQILYIVRNMILFYSEREVKEFTNKFVKLLKQDDRFLKDVHRSIDSAVKEENESVPPPVIFQFIKNWIGCNRPQQQASKPLDISQI